MKKASGSEAVSFMDGTSDAGKPRIVSQSIKRFRSSMLDALRHVSSVGQSFRDPLRRQRAEAANARGREADDESVIGTWRFRSPGGAIVPNFDFSRRCQMRSWRLLAMARALGS